MPCARAATRRECRDPTGWDKLDLFVHLLREEPVTWSGTTRAPMSGLQVYPRTEGGLRAWVGVGGSPESIVRAASYGRAVRFRSESIPAPGTSSDPNCCDA